METLLEFFGLEFFRNIQKKPAQYIIFRKESYFFVAERKCDKREIGKDPTKWLECNELDPFRIGKDMTERKMPVSEMALKPMTIVAKQLL